MRFKGTVERIKQLRKELLDYYISPMGNRLDYIQGELACLKGHHGASLVKNNNVVCSRCEAILGTITPAHTKRPTK